MIDYTLVKDFPLMKEQNEMIDFAIRRKEAVISGQTGLGKTYTALTLAMHLMLKYKNTATIIVCPPKALISFKRELEEKLKVSYSIVSTNENYIKENCRIVLISNTCLEKAVNLILAYKRSNFSLIGIVDESHFLQSTTTKQYKQFHNLRPFFTVLYFLTATSCKNNILGMYNMINLLKPNYLGSLSYFKSRYLIIDRRKVKITTKKGDKRQNRIEEIVGYKNLEELKRLLDNIIIVRQKEYNLKFQYHSVEPNETEVKAYLEASRGSLSEKAEDFWSVRLRDISLVIDNIHPDYPKQKLSTKERLLLACLKANIEDNKSCIIYCAYIEGVNRIKYLLDLFRSQLGIEDIFVIKGGVSLNERKRIEQVIGVHKPLIITSAGGESINLQRANNIIFYDLPYDISATMQVIGRITRVNTKYDTQYIDILELKGTVDTYKRLCLEKNMKLVETLFGKMNTLPITTYDNEQKFMRSLKNLILWAFRRGKLINDEELKELFNKYESFEE